MANYWKVRFAVAARDSQLAQLQLQAQAEAIQAKFVELMRAEGLEATQQYRLDDAAESITAVEAEPPEIHNDH